MNHEIDTICWELQSLSPWSHIRSFAPRTEDARPSILDKYWHRPINWSNEAAAKGIRYKVIGDTWIDFSSPEMQASERKRLWQLIRQTPRLDWVLPVTIPQCIRRCLPQDWGTGYPNVSLGAFISNRTDALEATKRLRKIPALKRFLWLEAMLGDIAEIDLSGIDWVVINHAAANCDTLETKWLDCFIDQCREQKVLLLTNMARDY